MARFGVDDPLSRHAETGNGQKKAIELRRRAHQLWYEGEYSKAEIARRLGVSRAFVVRWTQSPAQDVERDRRGWPKGLARQWDDRVYGRIQQLHAKLTRDPHEFFTGATAIQQHYRLRYPTAPVPPLRTIGRVLAQLGLSTPRKRGRGKGAARYLCYPEHTVYHTLGTRVLEVDFVGHKFLAGQRAPVHFIGFAFKLAPKLRYFQRVQSETSAVLIQSCQDFFARIETPDVVKVDNALAAIGSGSGQRTLSRFMVFLLEQQIVPVFAVPRKPFSQASIEGNNSVFARKFWNTQTFRSVRSLDRRLAWFNASSQRYSGYELPPPRQPPPRFVPTVYFIRQVHEHPAHPGTAGIDVLNDFIALPPSYVNYFVLAAWNLHSERLAILFETNSTTKRIKSMKFPINPNAQYKLR